jgi:hypothetical protein
VNLRQMQRLETAVKRLEEVRDRVGKLAEETGDSELVRMTGLLSIDLGTIRGISKRLQHGNT